MSVLSAAGKLLLCVINTWWYSVFRSNDRSHLCRERLGAVFKRIHPSRRGQAVSDQKVGGEVCIMVGGVTKCRTCGVGLNYTFLLPVVAVSSG